MGAIIRRNNDGNGRPGCKRRQGTSFQQHLPAQLIAQHLHALQRHCQMMSKLLAGLLLLAERKQGDYRGSEAHDAHRIVADRIGTIALPHQMHALYQTIRARGELLIIYSHQFTSFSQVSLIHFHLTVSDWKSILSLKESGERSWLPQPACGIETITCSATRSHTHLQAALQRA